MASQLYEGFNLYADLNEEISEWQYGSPLIRLFDLKALPARTRNEDTYQPIEGTFRVVPLYYTTRYAALSYVWGKKPQNGKSYTINCGDVKIAVSKSCVDALSCIREQFGQLSIWVDSICINQEDSAELEVQLPLMGEIYSQAQTVFIWVGPENRRANIGLQCPQKRAQGSTMRSSLERVETWTSQEISEIWRHKWFRRAWTFQELIMANNPVFLTGSQILAWDDILRARNQHLLMPPIMSSKSLKDLSAPVWDLVHLVDLWKSVPFSLSGYEFWTYMLIVLEIWSIYRCITLLQLHGISRTLSEAIFTDLFLLLTFGPRLILRIAPIHTRICRLFVGDPCRHCPFFRLFDVLPLLTKPFISVQIWNAITDLILLTFIKVARFYENIDWKTILGLISVYNKQRQLEYGSIIHGLRTREATKSIDQLRAFYPLLETVGAGTFFCSSLEEQEYHHFFMTLLCWRPMLVCLLIDAGLQNSTGFPTWVPRWNCLGRTAYTSEKCIYEITVGGIYNHISHHGLPLLHVVNARLSVFGCFLDTVACSIDVHRMDANADSVLVSAFLEWMARAQHFGNSQSFSFDEDFVNMLKHALIVGIEGVTAPDVKNNSVRAWLRIVIDNLDEYSWRRKYLGSGPHTDIFSQAVHRIRQNPCALVCHQALMKHTRGNLALFVTRQGRMGAGSIAIKSNDTIYRISGVPAPMVLRKQELAQEYQVVGPARISGDNYEHIWRYKFKPMDLV